ncbi:MAG: diguanylate cyclase, partial [Rhodospirillales bacterium]|nr:diguanylate cyclase [Rhodospirillales bacterium]
ELEGRLFAALSHAEESHANALLLAELLDGRQDESQAERRYLRRDGSAMWGRSTLSLVRGPLDKPQFAVVLVEDVSERKAMEERLLLSAKVFENTSEGVFVTDADHRILHVNPAFTALTGFTAEEVEGNTPAVLSSGRHGAEFYQQMQRALDETGKWQGEIWNRRKSGELFAEWLNVAVVRNERGQIINYVAVFSDITLRKQTEERLNYQANHDPLTSLPNRTLFHERLSRGLARAHRNHVTVAVLFLDLDHFKQINDTYGHLVGDLLLQAVSERLSNCTRQGDTVARLAGDEFTIILEDLADFRDAAVVAEKILRQLAEPFLLDGHRLTVTTSIGISLFPSDGEDIQTLVHNADAAMYRTKKLSRNAYQFYSEELNAQAFERLTLESYLRHALDRDELRLFYQPVFDLASGAIIGAEALLRWQHPEVGMVMPMQFLPIAEETGLITSIGRWVIERACRDAKSWQDKGHGELVLSVNLSVM